MLVPFVDFGQQYKNQKSQIDKAIQSCLERGKLILQDEVKEFEDKFAKFTDANFAVGLANGTDALILSLKALGIGFGDEVITVSYTFKATIEAIHHVGAIPILVDTDEHRVMDVEKLEAAITQRTKCIIPVHIEGGTCDMPAIKKLADQYGLFIVEDSCQALGASKLVGNVACYSFYPAKILGCVGDGGAIITNDPELADKIRLYRHHWQTGENERYGFNSRLDNIQAAILSIRLENIKDVIARRKDIADIYYRRLKDLPMDLPYKRKVYQDFVVLVDDPIDLWEFLRGWGIEALKPPVAPHISLNTAYILPKTEMIFQHSLRLPCNETLSDRQINYVADKINLYYENL